MGYWLGLGLRRKISYSNANGFGLVGALVSAGIVMIVATMTTNLLVSQSAQQKYLSQKLEMNDFTSNFISTMAKANSCDCQFAGNASNPNLANYPALLFDSTITNGSASIDLGKIYSGCAGGTYSPFVLAEAGSKLYGTNDLIVDKVRIVDLIPAGNATNVNEWYGAWEISFIVGSGSLQRPTKPIRVGQKFIINPAVPAQTRIASCNGMTNGSGTQNRIAKWSSTPGQLDDSAVFEGSNGNIGIGTASPGDPLDNVNMVSGLTLNGSGFTQLTVQRNGVSGFAMNIFNGDFHLHDKTGGVWHNSISSSNGNISLPSGALRVGNNPSLPCDASNEGFQRYNAGIHDYEFCNGTAWVQMGSPSAAVAIAAANSAAATANIANAAANSAAATANIANAAANSAAVTANAAAAAANAAAVTAAQADLRFGGAYVMESNFIVCSIPNSRTGGCSCPAGTSSHLIGQYYLVNPYDRSGFICY